MRRSYIGYQYSVQPPTVPTGLAATAVSTSQINLTWNASTDAGGPGLKDYGVYRIGTGLLGYVAGTSFSDTGLTASTTYMYRVTARDLALLESVQSGAVSATTFASGGNLVHGQPFTVLGANFGTDGSTLLVHDYGQDGAGVVSGQWTSHQPTTAGGIYNMQNQNPSTVIAGYAPGAPHPFVQNVLTGCHLTDNTPTGGNDVDVTKTLPSRTTPYPVWLKWWFCYHPLWLFGEGSPADDNNKYFNFNYATGGDDYAVDEWYFNYDDGSVTSVAKIHGEVSTNGATEGTFEVPPVGHQGGGFHSATFWPNGEDTSFNGGTTSTNWCCREIEFVADTVSWTTTGKGYINIWGTKLSASTYRFQACNYIGITDKVVNVGQRSVNLGGYARSRSASNFRFTADLFVTIGSTGDVTVNRLVLGNAATLAACTVIEYQPLVSWADGAITATCWKGKLQTGTVYPYIYNRNGTVVAGSPVTLS